MDSNNTRFMFHVEQKGYHDGLEHREYPDIVLTQYASFDGNERWPDVLRAFARFLSNVYGYDVEAEFNKIYVDPLIAWEQEQAKPKKKTKKAKD
jgi:hypothetical protein